MIEIVWNCSRGADVKILNGVIKSWIHSKVRLALFVKSLIKDQWSRKVVKELS